MGTYEGVGRGSFSGATVKSSSSKASSSSSNTSGGGGGGSRSSLSPKNTAATPVKSLAPGTYTTSGGQSYTVKAGPVGSSPMPVTRTTSGESVKQVAPGVYTTSSGKLFSGATPQQTATSSPGAKNGTAGTPTSVSGPSGRYVVTNPYTGQEVDLTAARNAREAFYAAGYQAPTVSRLNLERRRAITLKEQGLLPAWGVYRPGYETAGSITIRQQKITAQNPAEARLAGLSEPGTYTITSRSDEYSPRKSLISRANERLGARIERSPIAAISRNVETLGKNIREAGTSKLETITPPKIGKYGPAPSLSTVEMNTIRFSAISGGIVETLGRDVRERPAELLATAAVGAAVQGGIRGYEAYKSTRIVLAADTRPALATVNLRIAKDTRPALASVNLNVAKDVRPAVATATINVVKDTRPALGTVSIKIAKDTRPALGTLNLRVPVPTKGEVAGALLVTPFAATTGYQLYSAKGDIQKTSQVIARTGEDVAAFGGGYVAASKGIDAGTLAVKNVIASRNLRAAEKKLAGKLITTENIEEVRALQRFTTEVARPAIVVRPVLGIQKQITAIDRGAGVTNIETIGGTRLGEFTVVAPNEVVNPLQNYRVVRLSQKEQIGGQILPSGRRGQFGLSENRPFFYEKSPLEVQDTGVLSGGMLVQRLPPELTRDTPAIIRTVKGTMPVGINRIQRVRQVDVFEPIQYTKPLKEGEVIFENTPFSSPKNKGASQLQIGQRSMKKPVSIKGRPRSESLEFVNREFQMINTETGYAIEGIAVPSGRPIIKRAPLVIEKIRLQKKPVSSENPKKPLLNPGEKEVVGKDGTVTIVKLATPSVDSKLDTPQTSAKYETVGVTKSKQEYVIRSKTKRQRAKQGEAEQKNTIKSVEPQVRQKIEVGVKLKGRIKSGTRAGFRSSISERQAFKSDTSTAQRSDTSRAPQIRITPDVKRDTERVTQQEQRFKPAIFPRIPGEKVFRERTTLKKEETKIPKGGIPLLPRGARGSGYSVLVRRKGKFTRVTGDLLPAAEALKVGKELTGKSLAASFKIVGATGETIGEREALGALGPSYRGAKRERGVFVQKAGYRLSSLGERQEIKATRRGSLSRRFGL